MTQVVCNPILSLKLLFYLKFTNFRKNYTIYYELFPRYVNVILKLFSISESTLCHILNLFTGFNIKKIPFGNDVNNYHNIRMDIYIKIVDISEKFITLIKTDPWHSILGKLIHESVVVSTSTKYLAEYQLKHQLLAAKICKVLKIENSNENLILFNSHCWPDELLNIIRKDDYFSGIIFERPPSFFSFLKKLNILIKLSFIFFKSIFKHGISFFKIKKSQFEIATQIFDLNMLGGSTFDVDFFIDNKKFTYSNSLFYATSNFESILKKSGSKKIKQARKNKNLNFIELKNYSLSFKNVNQLLIWLIKTILNSIIKKDSLTFDLLPLIYDEHINYLVLFNHFDFKYHIHYTNTNGNGPLQFDSGIITGLCRQYNIKSFGIQNRIIDARESEYCFDTYDIYFSWGQAWIDVIGSALCFVKKTVIIGVTHLNEKIFSNVALLDRINKDNQPSSVSAKSVIIFPTDMITNDLYEKGGQGWYTVNYNIHFLKSCLLLAKLYPEIHFKFKLKDHNQVKIIKHNSLFKKLNIDSYDNFKILERGRMNYFDLLLKADIAISIGYTSPGLDALLLNKKSIYYSDLKNAGNAFKKVSGFVSEDHDDLISIFDKAVNNKIEYPNKHLLDPYQDGKAVKRMIDHLSENNL